MMSILCFVLHLCLLLYLTPPRSPALSHTCSMAITLLGYVAKKKRMNLKKADTAEQEMA